MAKIVGAVRRFGGWVVWTTCFASVFLSAEPPNRLTAQVLSPQDSARHVLNRLAYGPRPGEIDSVARSGVMRWIDQQLNPDHIRDDQLAQRERAFKVLQYDRSELAGRYAVAIRERQQMQRGLAETHRGPMAEFRELGGEFQQLA